MINSELLKDAIADAKAVRATALANAKAALEEAFAPRFEAMFAEKLKEESEEEEQEEGLQEVEAPNQVVGKGGEARGPKTKAVTKGNPKKVSDGNTNFKTVYMGQGPTDVPKADNKIDEAAEEEEEGKKMDEVAEEEQEEGKRKDEGYEEEEEGKVEEFGLTSEDLDDIIKELEQEVAGEEEGRREEPAPEPAPEEPEMGAPEGMPPAPEMGAPDGEPHAEPDGDEPVDVQAEPGSDVSIDVGPEAGAPEGLPGEAPAMGGAPGTQMPPPPVAPAGEEDDDENINLEELLAALNEESEEEEEEEEEEEGVDETVKNHGLPKNVSGQNKTGGTNTYPKGPDASKKQLPGKNHNVAGKGNIGSGAVAGKPMTEVTKYKTALKEAYKAIEFLRGQINEVNLLNSKLMYTNKLFKEFADVLDDPYRMKIVESFDLTKTVRETKLAYALLAESLSFGVQMKKTNSVKQVSKLVKQNGNIKQITEGLSASKPVASTKPSQLITEGNEMALRFKKLAGIKEAPKATSEKK